MSFFMMTGTSYADGDRSKKQLIPGSTVYKSFKDACDSVVGWAADAGEEITLNPSASEEETDDYPGTLVGTIGDDRLKFYVFQVGLAAYDDYHMDEFVAEHIKALMNPKARPCAGRGETNTMVRSVARKMLAATATVAAPPPLFTEPMFAQTVE
jgi:hypothetical protein